VQAAQNRLHVPQQTVGDLPGQGSLQSASLNELTALQALTEQDRNRLDRIDEKVHRLQEAGTGQKPAEVELAVRMPLTPTPSHCRALLTPTPTVGEEVDRCSDEDNPGTTARVSTPAPPGAVRPNPTSHCSALLTPTPTGRGFPKRAPRPIETGSCRGPFSSTPPSSPSERPHCTLPYNTLFSLTLAFTPSPPNQVENAHDELAELTEGFRHRPVKPLELPSPSSLTKEDLAVVEERVETRVVECEVKGEMLEARLRYHC